MKLILVTVLVFSGIISANAADITIKITSKYLNLPVSQKQDRKVMRFEMEDKEERAFKIRLAGEPEYWGNSSGSWGNNHESCKVIVGSV